MKAVMSEVPEHILQWRKTTGAYYWDEMWEGVLHMTPVPTRRHQDFQGALFAWLRIHWALPRGCRVYPPMNIASPGGWPNNYRIPDIVLLTPDRFHIDHDEYFEGGPTVVVENRSRGDESYEKLPFYAGLGVPEVWIIDRDTKVPQLFVLAGAAYQDQPAGPDGWLASAATGVWLRGEAGEKLAARLADQPDSLSLLPD